MGSDISFAAQTKPFSCCSLKFVKSCLKKVVWGGLGNPIHSRLATKGWDRAKHGITFLFGYVIKRGPDRTNGPILKVYSRSPVRVLLYFL